MEPQIILYDILINADNGARQGSSPNPWKVRQVLNYKSVPYKTIWVEYADIQLACASIPSARARIQQGNRKLHTLPTIFVPATGEVISDSGKIVAYLDEYYPERPIFPLGKEKEQLAFEQQLLTTIGKELPLFLICRNHQMMTPTSASAMEKFAVGTLGLPPFKNIPPRNAENLKIIREGFSKVADKCYDKRQYLFGDAITFADFLVSSYLVGLTRCMTDEEIVDFQAWDGGKWAEILEIFKDKGFLSEDEGDIFEPSSVASVA